VAESEADCRGSNFCKLLGKCKFEEGECVTGGKLPEGLGFP